MALHRPLTATVWKPPCPRGAGSPLLLELGELVAEPPGSPCVLGKHKHWVSEHTGCLSSVSLSSQVRALPLKGLCTYTSLTLVTPLIKTYWLWQEVSNVQLTKWSQASQVFLINLVSLMQFSAPCPVGVVWRPESSIFHPADCMPSFDQGQGSHSHPIIRAHSLSGCLPCPKMRKLEGRLGPFTQQILARLGGLNVTGTAPCRRLSDISSWWLIVSDGK